MNEPFRRAGQRLRHLFPVAPALAAVFLLTSCSELDYLRAKTDMQDQTLSEMEKQLKTWQDAYENLSALRTKDTQEFQKQLALRDQELRRLRTGKTDRERELERQINEMTLRAQQEIDKNLALGKKSQATETRLSTLEKEHTSLKSTQSKVEKDLVVANGQVASLQSSLAETEQARQTAEKRAKALEAERDQLKSSLDDSNNKIRELERTVADLKIAPKSASDGRTSVSAQVAEIKKQLTEERRSSENERQKLKSEVARLTKELSKLRGGAPVEDVTLTKAKEALEKALADEIKQKNAEVIAAPDRVTVRLRSDSLFQPSTLMFHDSAQADLRQIAQILAKYGGYQLRVEGHTDNQPVRDMPFPDNLALSSQRAGNVLRFLMESAPLPQKQIRSIGCADHEPIASNDTPDGRARNRRVEIILSRPD